MAHSNEPSISTAPSLLPQSDRGHTASTGNDSLLARLQDKPATRKSSANGGRWVAPVVVLGIAALVAALAWTNAGEVQRLWLAYSQTPPPNQNSRATPTNHNNRNATPVNPNPTQTASARSNTPTNTQATTPGSHDSGVIAAEAEPSPQHHAAATITNVENPKPSETQENPLDALRDTPPDQPAQDSGKAVRTAKTESQPTSTPVAHAKPAKDTGQAATAQNKERAVPAPRKAPPQVAHNTPAKKEPAPLRTAAKPATKPNKNRGEPDGDVELIEALVEHLNRRD